MPNFDGNGPLKRGRVIGRGRGPCARNARKSDEASRNDGDTAAAVRTDPD